MYRTITRDITSFMPPSDPKLEEPGSLHKPPPRITIKDVGSEEQIVLFFDVTVRCNRRITAEDWFQDARHFELVSDCDIKSVQACMVQHFGNDISSYHPGGLLFRAIPKPSNVCGCDYRSSNKIPTVCARLSRTSQKSGRLSRD